MTFIPRAQEIYKHFKGNLYQIVSVAEHTETGEALVVYQAMYGDFKVYARPLEMFCSKVDKAKYPNVEQEYRFELLKAWNTTIGSQAEKPEKKGVAVCENIRSVEVGQAVAVEAVQAPAAVDIATVIEEEPALDPMLLAFLDAESYTEKLNILAGMHHHITDDMITTMAIASDVEIAEGDLETRYTQLKNCLLTLDRYEITRLR